jgi:hypothetical protein
MKENGREDLLNIDNKNDYERLRSTAELADNPAPLYSSSWQSCSSTALNFLDNPHGKSSRFSLNFLSTASGVVVSKSPRPLRRESGPP